MQPFGDRSKVVIEPMLTDQWFVDTDKIVGPALDAVRNGDVKSCPSSGEKVYFHWLENIEPWCISRQLVVGASDTGLVWAAKRHVHRRRRRRPLDYEPKYVACFGAASKAMKHEAANAVKGSITANVLTGIPTPLEPCGRRRPRRSEHSLDASLANIH